MKVIRGLVIIINALLILALVFGFLRQYIDPSHASFLTLFSLLYPYIVVALFISFLLLIIVRSRWLWASLIALVFTSGNTIRQIGFHINPASPPDSTVYTLSTLNIKNNFRHRNQDQSEVFVNDFKNKTPSILLLQEISGILNHKVKEALGYPYSSNNSNSGHISLAIFSEYPLKTVMWIKNKDGRIISLVTDVQLPESMIRVFNIHLHTNAVTVRAGKFSTESFSRKESLKALRDMLKTYSENASLRISEIEEINKEIDNSPYPVVIAGDLNDTPYSPVYRRLKRTTQNAFVEGGLGFAQTYNGLLIPLKIDQIFFDRTFTIHRTEIKKIEYSDHNPITTSFSITK